MERKFDYESREKGPCYSDSPYRLPRSQWSDQLAAKFADYEQWRTGIFVSGRPRRCKQRPETFASSVIEFECYFGYLTGVRGRDADKLYLDDICRIEWLRSYAEWHAKHRTGSPSRFIEKSLSDFLSAARHYLKADATTLDAMSTLKAEVEPDVRDKQERWNSLSTLEAVGLAEYSSSNGRSQIRVALTVQRSPLIRLLVRRPLRSRNIREMLLGKNLFRENGSWVIQFRGKQMKVGKKNGRQNVFRLSFPHDLVPLLEEYLETWRPVLNHDELPCMFVTTKGQAWSRNALNTQIKKAIYAYTGKATNIHLFRDIWATEFILTRRTLSPRQRC